MATYTLDRSLPDIINATMIIRHWVREIRIDPNNKSDKSLLSESMHDIDSLLHALWGGLTEQGRSVVAKQSADIVSFADCQTDHLRRSMTAITTLSEIVRRHNLNMPEIIYYLPENMSSLDQLLRTIGEESKPQED